ncbi:hypothetical protein ACGFXC_06340 [Streptomyces sp. NPDC048507]|uniref:hypothetical protein n=1 Tax=Streptomyces sp. NPDC048507 TaxID=3365560 RepID=UPI00371F61F3
MTAVHRPLTLWVRAARPAPLPAQPGPAHDGGPARGAVRWSAYGPLNEGDERADARDLPRFADGWQRRSLPLTDGGEALGLYRPDTGEAYLELDDDARPLPADPDTAEAVAAIERRWPALRLADTERDLLAAADPGLSFSLLDRLADEGRPEPECFHVLPWERVERLAAEVTRALRAPGTAPAGATPRLRHYFAPTGSRFSAALEQLAAAQRAADPRIRRVATTALCTRLMTAPADRMPAGTRSELAELLTAIAESDALLGATARAAAARLAARESGRTVLYYGSPARVRNQFAPTASGGTQQAEDSVEREAVTLRLAVDSHDEVSVVITATLPADTARSLPTDYGVVLLPVRVTGVAGHPELYVLLVPTGAGLSGDLGLRAVPGAEISADQSGPPLGAEELPFLDVRAVRATMSATIPRTDRRTWRTLAGALPEGHPVRAAIKEDPQS